jgi:hypothetical protein
MMIVELFKELMRKKISPLAHQNHNEGFEPLAREVRISCYWSDGTVTIELSRAKELFDENNLICRECRGCQC